MAATYECTAAQVLAAFSEKPYWLTRLEKSGCDETSLDVLETTADGSIEVITTQTVRPAKLPAVVTQFHRGDLTLRRREHWTALAGGSSTGTIDGDLLGTPARVTATVALADTSPHARADVHVTVEVKIPLVGGKLESYLGGQLVDLLRLEQVFTSKWIQDHG